MNIWNERIILSNIKEIEGDTGTLRYGSMDIGAHINLSKEIISRFVLKKMSEVSARSWLLEVA